MSKKGSNYNIVTENKKSNTRNFICAVSSVLLSKETSFIKYISVIMRRSINALKLHLSMFTYNLGFRLSLKQNMAQILTR